MKALVHKDDSLHHYARRFECVLNRIFPDKFPVDHIRYGVGTIPLCEKNKVLLWEFYLHNEAMGSLSIARRARVLMLIAKLGELLGDKVFSELTRQDMQLLVAQVRQYPGWSEVTQNYHLKAMKKFLKHLNGGENYPECISWLKIKERKNSPIRKEDLITEEEMGRMLQVNTNPMHRCLLALLWEGLRVGELGMLKIKNITFEGREAFVSVKGKTGERTVMSITGAPYIRQWLDFHPSQDPEDWLFVISSNYNKGKRFGYSSILKIVRNACQKANIKSKRTHPHLFRHSSITDRRRKGMRQREASAFYGVSGLVMSQVYDHLADSDVHNEIRRVLGVKIEEPTTTNKMEPKPCQFCQKLNPHYSNECLNCGNSFSLPTAIKQKDQFQLMQEQKNKLKLELDAMRSMMDEINEEMNKISYEKKAEIMQKIKGGIVQ